MIKENNITVGNNMSHHMMSQGSHQPTNMMGRRLADQNHHGVTGGSNQHFSGSQGPVGGDAIIGISGGMVRLKGNSPKVSSKDGHNRPRTIK